MHRHKVRGPMLDRLCKDKVFERGKGGFLVVEGMNSAYFSNLSPVDLIELGAELVLAGNEAIKKECPVPPRHGGQE